MSYAGNRVVIQVAMGNFEAVRKVVLVYGKAVILGGDFYLARF